MPDKRPNLLLIITDNQAADLLGCYGNEEMHSPHLDQMAADGLRFTNAFCPNAMCSPCRASIFTGQMPSHHGVHTWIDDRRMPNWPSDWNAVGEYQTLPKRLKAAGYHTALIGKYHLGIPGTADAGIDHWITMERGHTLDFHGNTMSINGERIVHEGHSVEFFTDHAIEYLKSRSAHSDQPFALILAYNGPYGHWPSIKGKPDNRFYELYADCPMNSVPREGLCKETVDLYDLQKHLGGTGGPDFSAVLRIPNDLISLRNYYSQMSLIDDCIGRLLFELEQQRLSDDTISIFTADHGFSLGHHGFWGHAQATWPSNMHRIAYNVPLILHNPSRWGPGKPEAMVSTMDLYATMLDWAGVDLGEEISPSRSLSQIADGQTGSNWEDVVFFEQEESRAVRTSDWLFVMRVGTEQGPIFESELYDLREDSEERTNIASKDEFRPVVEQLTAKIDEFFMNHAKTEHDLWNGGVVKSNTSRPWLWPKLWGEDWKPVP